MAHLIDKDAFVEEIKKLMYAAITEADIASTGECFNEDIAEAKHQLCEYILGVIDTIEVKKEVDFDKEIAKFFGDDDWKAGAIEEEQRAMIKFAKHFFELGFKAQKGE